MSSFKASVANPCLTGALRRSCYAIGLSLALSTLSTQAFAVCQYTVTGQWSNGFTGSVKITNDTATATNSWSLSWQYAGDNRISGSYDVSMSGTNPYTAKNAGWNGTIQPNQSVTFGFQGSKGAAAAEVPVLTGTLCGNATSSSRSSAISSSSISSVDGGGWSLNSTDSYLNFVTTKNTHNVEAHNFTGLSGEINPAGIATLMIDLNSVNTGVALRDQRMRDLLFETLTYPTATVTMTVPASVIGGLAVGQSSQNDITASLNLHGVTANITTRVLVQRLSASRVLVQSLAPVLTKADTYSLANGVEALRAAVGIASINASVPVDFTLVFDAR